MIVDLPDTTTGAVAKKIVDLRDAGGAVALGRVMTLLIVTDDGPAEEAIRAANDASREHPCRVIAIVRGNKRGVNRLDTTLRRGAWRGGSVWIIGWMPAAAARSPCSSISADFGMMPPRWEL